MIIIGPVPTQSRYPAKGLTLFVAARHHRSKETNARKKSKTKLYGKEGAT